MKRALPISLSLVLGACAAQAQGWEPGPTPGALVGVSVEVDGERGGGLGGGGGLRGGGAVRGGAGAVAGVRGALGGVRLGGGGRVPLQGPPRFGAFGSHRRTGGEAGGGPRRTLNCRLRQAF